MKKWLSMKGDPMKKLTLVKSEPSREVHCECCLCPKEHWAPFLKTYNGDQCQLYEAFDSLLEDDGMTAEMLTELAMTELPKEFTDITDLAATVEEMMEIIIDCGILCESSPGSSTARPLTLVPSL